MKMCLLQLYYLFYHDFQKFHCQTIFLCNKLIVKKITSSKKSVVV